MEFDEAVQGLRRGDLSRLDPLFVGGETPPGTRPIIVEWHEAGRFADEPFALAEALTCACFNGRVAVAEYLLNLGVDPSGGSGTGLNALHWAANRGQLEAVRLLLRHNAPLETRSMYDGTVLGIAVWSAIHEPRGSQVEIIDELLSAGARLEEVDYPSGDSAVDAILRKHGAEEAQMREWEQALERWRKADLIDAAAAERIRLFEESRTPEAKSEVASAAAVPDQRAPGLRWPAIVALVFGGLMLGAGVLLFVAAHWDNMSPAGRFALVVAMVAVFHGAGAFSSARNSENLATVMHGLGTGVLGAGIFLAGQIFNLQAHWPSGIMLWAAGAWIGYALRRDWVQLAMAAILTPFWLAGEWIESFFKFDEGVHTFRVLAEGMLLLAITYFAARTRDLDSPTRRALVWIGGIAFLPWAVALAVEREIISSARWQRLGTREIVGYTIAFGLPLVLAGWLRKRDVWMNVIAAVWVVLLASFAAHRGVGVYAWCGLGAAGLVAWGVRDARSERVNMGMVGFAITLFAFYFSEVMDKLDRSASLIGLGVLFLAGGWGLERLRRRFVAQAREVV